MQETRVLFLGWEDPLEEGMASTPVFLPGKCHGQRNLEANMTERSTENRNAVSGGDAQPCLLEKDSRAWWTAWELQGRLAEQEVTLGPIHS